MQQQGYRAPSQSRDQRELDVVKNEFLTFRLGAESYGIEILKVQEIRGYEAPTTIANAPPFIKGVINLRGVIVPILDLRVKFRLPDSKYDEFTVVIILNVASRVVGVVVDSVSDVVSLSVDEVRAAPEFASTTFDTRYITGLANVEEGMLIMLDIEKLLTGSDMALVDSVMQ
ncbi:chemotaxis protein CheW [Ramlibacter sp. WS9]|jgi:purine-binding chemotaxis protein CheW|uniref:chemotaxis protein CheW n=1 Tax=Ramlibacter sp. WS9 TaxID=1882741 RepID=UPI0011423D19|nr:chemotaxis protein CheW [Ramlibacter sp. WS9]ROZ62583.1 chemotaxis protein CheW [Ramlibacter sp. WS9]